MSVYSASEFLLPTQPTYTFHGGPSPRPRRCHACKKASCSNTPSPMCQTYDNQEKKSRIQVPNRFGIGGAGNIGSRKAGTDEDWLEYMTGERATRKSFQSVSSGETDEHSIRHFGIGGAGNVAEGRTGSLAASSSSESKSSSETSEARGKLNKGLRKIVRHCGIGGVGNVMPATPVIPRKEQLLFDYTNGYPDKRVVFHGL